MFVDACMHCLPQLRCRCVRASNPTSGRRCDVAMGQDPVPPVNIPIPTKIDYNGWCTCPKMVPLALTHSHGFWRSARSWPPNAKVNGSWRGTPQANSRVGFRPRLCDLPKCQRLESTLWAPETASIPKAASPIMDKTKGQLIVAFHVHLSVFFRQPT